MGDVISLNQARKKRSPRDKERQSAFQRVRSGRTKEQRAKEAFEKDKQTHTLDVLRLAPPSEDHLRLPGPSGEPEKP